MPFLKRLNVLNFGDKTASWHNKINDLTSGQEPTTEAGELNADFPWIAVRLFTDSHVSKRSKPNTVERQSTLIELVHSHASKDIAIAACGHLLSAQTVHNLLMWEFGNGTEEDAVISRLKSIIVLKHVNGDVVVSKDSRLAQDLLRLINSSSHNIADRFVLALSLFTSSRAPDSFCAKHLDEISSSTFRRFAEHLESLVRSCQWKEAWTISRTVLMIRPMIEKSKALERLLESTFPDWVKWERWQPGSSRVQLWEIRIPEHLKFLRGISSLLAPDSTNNYQCTLLAGIIAQRDRYKLQDTELQIGNVTVIVDIKSDHSLPITLATLCETLDSSCRAGWESLRFFNSVCVEPLTLDMLKFVKTIVELDDPVVLPAVQRALFSTNDEQRLAGIQEVLHCLNTEEGSQYREPIGNMMSARIVAAARKLQLELTMTSFDQWYKSVDKAIELSDLFDTVQATGWIVPFLSEPQKTVLNAYPKAATLRGFRDILEHASNMSDEFSVQLFEKVANYYSRHVSGGTGNDALNDFDHNIASMIKFWPGFSKKVQQNIAVLAVDVLSEDASTYSACLATVSALPMTMLTDLERALEMQITDSGLAWAVLATSLNDHSSYQTLSPWIEMLMVFLHASDDHEMTNSIDKMGTKLLFLSLRDLNNAFGVGWRNTKCNRDSHHCAEISRTCEWIAVAAPYVQTICDLEDLGYREAARCLRIGGYLGPGKFGSLLQVLKTLSEVKRDTRGLAMKKIVAELKVDGTNAGDIDNLLKVVEPLAADTMIVCVDLIVPTDSNYDRELEFLKAYTRLRFEDETTMTAYRGLAKHFEIELNAMDIPVKGEPKQILALLESESKLIREKAEALEGQRSALMRKDRAGTTKILQEVGIEWTSAADEALGDIPAKLVDVVERIDDEVIEMYFPLTHLTPLQRLSFGVRDSQNLIIRLNIADLTFCIHISGNFTMHQPYSAKAQIAPNKSSCAPNESCRMTYQLSRALWRHLQYGFHGLERLHTVMTNSINGFNKCCMICGSIKLRSLHRSTVCQDTMCSKLLPLMNIHARAADMFQDPLVVQALLASVHATAACGKMDLIKDCPIQGPSLLSGDILLLLNSIKNCKITTTAAIGTAYSSTSELQSASVTSSSKDSMNFTSNDWFQNQPVEKLLTWICNSHRGFLVTAASSCLDASAAAKAQALNFRIPALPNVHQFVLANASPDLERQFANHMKTYKNVSHVVFHGTTMDRLFPILTQGLKVCSGTSLQANGAAYGKGVYVSEEPGTAFQYARTMTSSGIKTSPPTASPFGDVKVVLACELAGDQTRVASGITVIPDATRLMVRMVFLVPHTASAPIRRHVEPALKSVYATLRGGRY